MHVYRRANQPSTSSCPAPRRPSSAWQSSDCIQHKAVVVYQSCARKSLGMKPSKTSLLLLSAACLLLHHPAFFVHGQDKCYYPNGALAATDDHPCSSDGYSTCCPLNWQCLSNGLCYLENEGYLGRYTCTDSAWESDNCPNICTHGMFPYSFGSFYLIVCQEERPPGMRRSKNAVKTPIAVMRIVLKLDVVRLPIPTTSSLYQMGP